MLEHRADGGQINTTGVRELSSVAMILEAALLDVIPGHEPEFENSFARASPLIAATPGYLGHSLRRCVEHPSRYLLLVRWKTLEDHTHGFRTSSRYEEWKALLHRFYEPFPTVEHFAPAVFGSDDWPFMLA